MAECIENNWQAQLLPKKVYKYRQINLHAESMIIGRELYFSSVKEFNDPFDCLVQFSAECTLDEFIDACQQMPKLSEWPQDEIAKCYKNRRQRLNDFIPRLEKHTYDTGVFCLSENPDSCLMWSHYAANHTGICLEFDTTVGGVESIFNQKFLRPVEYKEGTPIFAPFRDSNLSDLVRKSLFRKSIDWAYEKEWRIIWTKGAKGVKNYVPGELTRIILGVNTSEEDEKRVNRWLQSIQPTAPKMSRARIEQGSYDILIE